MQWEDRPKKLKRCSAFEKIKSFMHATSFNFMCMQQYKWGGASKTNRNQLHQKATNRLSLRHLNRAPSNWMTKTSSLLIPSKMLSTLCSPPPMHSFKPLWKAAPSTQPNCVVCFIVTLETHKPSGSASPFLFILGCNIASTMHTTWFCVGVSVPIVLPNTLCIACRLAFSFAHYGCKPFMLHHMDHE